MPMYWYPCARAASAIASSVSAPSEAVVWACRTPNRSVAVTSGGMLCEAACVSEIDRHLARGDYLRWAGEPFDLRDQSQVRNELAAAAEVAGGDGADQAGHGTPQRFGSREGQLVGAVQVAGAQCGFPNFQPFEDLALHRGSQPLHLLEPVLARRGLKSSEVGNAEFLVEDVDLLRLQPGDREHVEHAFRDVPAQFFQQRVLRLERLSQSGRNIDQPMNMGMPALVLDHPDVGGRAVI